MSLAQFLESRDMVVFGNINDSYPTNAAEVDSKLTELVNISCDDSLTDYERLQILCLIQKVAQRNPQIFTENQVELIASLIDSSDLVGQMVYAVLVAFTQVRPHLLVATLDVLVKTLQGLACPDMSTAIITYWSHASLVSEALSICEQNDAAKVLDILLKYIDDVTTSDQGIIMACVSLIVMKYKNIVKPHRERIQQLSKNPSLTDVCSSILAVLNQQ